MAPWGPALKRMGPQMHIALPVQDMKPYTDRIKEAQDKTGLQDGVRTGTGLLHGIPVALGVMDFSFMGGSMVGRSVGQLGRRLGGGFLGLGALSHEAKLAHPNHLPPSPSNPQGSVVGEKLTRLIEYATQEGLALMIVCASGGARMQEGIMSLMQVGRLAEWRVTWLGG